MGISSDLSLPFDFRISAYSRRLYKKSSYLYYLFLRVAAESYFLGVSFGFFIVLVENVLTGYTSTSAAYILLVVKLTRLKSFEVLTVIDLFRLSLAEPSLRESL